MLTRFLREAQAAARLRSGNVVQILDHGVHEGIAYIAMECLDGESLAQRLDRERMLGLAATALVLTGVCRALARAQRLGIVHRDLQPDNIFLARDEAGTIVKVLDFGIAKILEQVSPDPHARTEPNQRTEGSAMLGTPCYTSPEQARGHRTLDGRSDLWSLAVITFECLTGRRPFDAGVMGELMMQICSDPVPRPSSIAEVPPGFDAWFARAMERDPAARFQSVRELADALAEILTPGRRWLDAVGESEAIAPAESRGAEASSPVNQTEAPLVIPSGRASRASARRRFATGAALAVVFVGTAIGIVVSTPRGAIRTDTLAATPAPTGTVLVPASAPAVASAPSAAPSARATLAATAAPTASARPSASATANPPKIKRAPGAVRVNNFDE